MLLNCGIGKVLRVPWTRRRSAMDFFGRNDAKAETPVLQPPHETSWLIRKDSDPRRNWEQEEKRTTEDEMAGWHHWLDGHEFEWTPGVGDGQGGLACCNSWGSKESDMTERLNWSVDVLRHLAPPFTRKPFKLMTLYYLPSIVLGPGNIHMKKSAWSLPS